MEPAVIRRSGGPFPVGFFVWLDPCARGFQRARVMSAVRAVAGRRLTMAYRLRRLRHALRAGGVSRALVLPTASLWPQTRIRCPTCRSGCGISRISAVSFPPALIRLTDCRPCFHMPCPSPRGTPGDAPPCRRQRPFAIAGERQEFPALFRAPQRAAACACSRLMSQNGVEFTGLSLTFRSPGRVRCGSAYIHASCCLLSQRRAVGGPQYVSVSTCRRLSIAQS